MGVDTDEIEYGWEWIRLGVNVDEIEYGFGSMRVRLNPVPRFSGRLFRSVGVFIDILGNPTSHGNIEGVNKWRYSNLLCRVGKSDDVMFAHAGAQKTPTEEISSLQFTSSFRVKGKGLGAKPQWSSPKPLRCGF